MTVLETVKSFLDQEKFECRLVPAKSEFPFDRLFVFLALDAKKRERILEIYGSHQQGYHDFMLQKVTLPLRLQFRVTLPYKIQDRALNQVAHLLHFLNQTIDLPGFELNELEGRVIYRYVWMTEPALIQPSLVMGIVGAIMLNFGIFADTIESLAEGKMTFNEYLTQIVKIAEISKEREL